MASSFESFKELNLTKDEVERFTDALKDQKFRKLLTEYVEEIKDPENQKIYQEEITEFEKERGIDVTFINPVAGYVIKTSLNGATKTFINICTNENINKPTSNVAFQEGTRGLQWSLPHSLAPPREDLDNKGLRCQVYDVVFHPDTLHLAQKNKAFRDMVNKTACDAIESSYDVTLDRKNLRFPKLQYKGMPRAAVIRQPSKDPPPELNPEEKALMDKLYSQIDAANPPKSPQKSRKLPSKNKNTDNESTYTTPTYIVKHRRHIEMEEFTEHKTAKINTATPKELIIEINLPLLKSSNDIILDVTEKSLHLISEKPAKYKLSITLPYRVNQEIGNAKFDKDGKKLVVTLPVRTNTGILLSEVGRDDSGVESDHGSSIPASPNNEIDPASLITILKSENDFVTNTNCNDVSVNQDVPFLSPELHYTLPEFTTNVFKNNIAFTFNVKNVNETSICKIVTESDLHIKFSNISAGFYPTYYAFYVQFLHHTFDKDKLSVETWDNNVVVQINFNSTDLTMNSYLFGLDKNNLSEKYLDEPTVLNEAFQRLHEEVQCEEKVIKTVNCRKTKKKGKKVEEENVIQYESSSDEISHSFSPSKSRGILKNLPSPRRFGRSISESGIDEASWKSSIENCTSVDSIIPEENEMSTSLKKTVRFNDVVSRQLFRSNSSILGQRKKNQRKAKAKKRAQGRRHSDGEATDISNEKERDVETADEEIVNIFELDLNS